MHHAYTYTHTHTYTHLHTLTHTYTLLRKHTYTHTFMHYPTILCALHTLPDSHPCFNHLSMYTYVPEQVFVVFGLS